MFEFLRSPHYDNVNWRYCCTEINTDKLNLPNGWRGEDDDEHDLYSIARRKRIFVFLIMTPEP